MPIARPTSTPKAFATNAFVRAEPGSTQTATGITAGQRISRALMNWLWGVPLEWAAYHSQFTNSDDEVVYPVAKTRVFTIVPTQLGHGAGSWSGAQLTLDPPRSGAGGEFCYHDLGRDLRTGQSLAAVQCVIDPGGTGVVTVKLLKSVGAGTVQTNSQIGTSGVSDGTAAIQFVTLPAFTAEVINRATTRYFLEVSSGNAGDVFYNINVSLSDVGPRNPS